MRLLTVFLQRIAPTTATVVFGMTAWDEVIPTVPEKFFWDPFVPYLTLGCGMLIVWLGLSVVCAGVRWTASRLHWLPRWMAYIALTVLSAAVPFMLFAPRFIASAVCREEGCDVGPNWDGFVILIDNSIQPNLVWWPVVSAVTVGVAAWMAHAEQKLTIGETRSVV
jgi:hypothetical protein